jgi:hypothetical protein
MWGELPAGARAEKDIAEIMFANAAISCKKNTAR